VTNEGGITSHASIVAREMGKPCIIGAKIATKVLKDGDLVEVDADEGVVRVLESGKATEKKHNWQVIAKDFNSPYLRNYLWTASLLTLNLSDSPKHLNFL
jgi:phosphoenolpyruvate synthase/pyruvate phosphate dikinase